MIVRVGEDKMKHRIVHTLQKYFLNPPIKVALAMGLPLPGYALLETKGRKTGKARRTPVGDGRVGNQFWLVAEHGTKAGYVVSANAGWLLICQAAQEMRGRCAFSGRNSYLYE